MASNNKELKQIRIAAERRGWEVEQTNGSHLRWKHPSGAVMFSSLTPSDFRALKKIKAFMNKIETGRLINPRMQQETV